MFPFLILLLGIGHNHAASLKQNLSNMSPMEVCDRNNVMLSSRESAALKKHLEKNHGTCQQGLITSISKPFVVQLKSGHRYGGWGRDALAGANQDVHWVAPLSANGRLMNSLCMYNTSSDSVALKSGITHGIYGQGGGMIMYNNAMYFNCYNSGNLCRYNLQTSTKELSINLPDAAYNNRFSYSSSAYQDIDMAGDEEGLWAIYSTKASVGNFVISKIDPISLAVKQTWTTAQYKPAVTNAFMACGVLYATRAISTKQEEIFYMYDTKTEKEGSFSLRLEKPKDTNTEKEGWLSITLEKPSGNVQSLSYNPNDHKLYMYNDGYLVTYDVNFKH